jgi:thiamine-phosphate pyrophosphorylase
MHNYLPRFFTFIKTFDKDYIKKLDNNIGIIYRNYSINYDKKLIEEMRNFCKKNNKKFYLSNNIILAKNLRLDGVYIPSFNSLLNTDYLNQKKNFLKIGSAHSIKEIRIKEKQGVKLLFISPLFKKKKKKFFLDCVKFNNLVMHTSLKIIALGGIDKKNISRIKLTKAYGFASITFFKENPTLTKEIL